MSDIEEVRRDWTRLGADDPLWAVCVAPGKRHGGWDTGEFLATGRDEIDAVMAWLERLALRPGTARALDFGCGAGRLTQALAGHFDEVTGVDIAPPMLERARELDRTGGRCTFVLNDEPDLRRFPGGSFDFAYSNLVLQHLPPALARGYLAELVRVLAPGGVLVVGVPTRPQRTVKGLLFRYAPRPLLRLGQRWVLGYPAPMRMHGIPYAEMAAIVREHGARIADTAPFDGGPHWNYTRYAITHGS